MTRLTVFFAIFSQAFLLIFFIPAKDLSEQITNEKLIVVDSYIRSENL